MKELSIEEKAKRYDEAIKVAKSNYETIVQMDKECTFAKEGIVNTFHHMFPELKEESDDERIRKAIIEHFEWSTKRILNEYSNKKVIAWLEKQGEKESVTCPICGWEIKKPGERKPANRVEPKFKVGDKIYLKPEYRMPDDDTPIANTVKEIIKIDDKHYRFDGSCIFIEDQDKYELVEQKLAEWSEEDENNLNSCISKLEIDMQHWEGHGKTMVDGDRKLISWLKSIRPQSQWKPSEEQIEILDMVLTNESIDDNIARILRELREQLKKLKG